MVRASKHPCLCPSPASNLGALDITWRKTKPTTPLGVGSPSDPYKHYRSHFGSSSGPQHHACDSQTGIFDQTLVLDSTGYRPWMCGMQSTTLPVHATRAYGRQINPNRAHRLLPPLLFPLTRFAVRKVAGLCDTRTVPELRSLLPSMCIEAPGSMTNSLSPRVFGRWCWETPILRR